MPPVHDFPHPSYVVRRKVFKLVGGAFHIYDPTGAVVAFSEQKAFKLKEDIAVYSDESKTAQLLSIQARSIIDFSMAYDVTDSVTGERIGALRRCGGRSLLRDEWKLLDDHGTEYATLIEDSMVLALLRRLLSNLIPQHYDVLFSSPEGAAKVATLVQDFNPFVYRLTVDVSMDPERRLDRRMAIAAAILLAAVEGSQE